MVDTIQELSELSRKLNEKSDQLNSVIESINQKLSALNLGVEVWLEDEPIAAGDYEDTYKEDRDGDQVRTSRKRNATILGYCRFDDGWQLAVKEVLLVTEDDWRGGECEVVTNPSTPLPLLQASREERMKSTTPLPRLLDEMKSKAERLLKSIVAAEEKAKKL